MTFNLSEFKLPKNFRGRGRFTVQLWWIVSALLVKPSPQLMYKWRVFLLRLFGARIGQNVLIRPGVEVTYPWKLSIGDNAWIGDDVTLYTLGEISVGDNTVISQKSYICTGSHDYSRSTFDIFAKKVSIGASSWIATDVFVAPGVTIGDNVVVGARSSVFKDLDSNGVYAGSPAMFVKAKTE